jgi:hypothetical protein
MIYDQTTQRWYQNESHLNACKAGLERNQSLQMRLPLHPNAVAEQAENWNAMPK